MMWCTVTPHRYPSLTPEADSLYALGSTKQRAAPDFGDGIFAITITFVHVKSVESQLGSIPEKGEMTLQAFGLRLSSHSRAIVRAFDVERRENALSSCLPVPFYDIEDSILADFEITGDSAVSSSLADGLKDLWRGPV